MGKYGGFCIGKMMGFLWENDRFSMGKCWVCIGKFWWVCIGKMDEHAGFALGIHGGFPVPRWRRNVFTSVVGKPNRKTCRANPRKIVVSMGLNQKWSVHQLDLVGPELGKWWFFMRLKQHKW